MRKHTGADWIQAQQKDTPMSELGIDVANFLGDLYQGIYHISGPGLEKVDWTNNVWIEISLVAHRSLCLATWDFDDLTAIVLLSHDRCLRVTIQPNSYRTVKLMFHRRKRGNDISREIPTMEDHIARLRARFGEPKE